jgi:hypothetical protein
MKRTYLASLGLSLAGVTAAALQPQALAAALFSSQPLDGTRFAVLGKPVGRNDWTLLVLEQIAAAPRCWEPRPDGLVDPSLNRFDFTGICSRYLDSNGYSLRIGEQDLATRYRLRLQQQGSSLQLLAMSPSQASELLVGRGTVNQRDRDGFVPISLEPGWSLERRVYGGQTLSHIYFANGTPLAQLIGGSGGASVPLRPLTPLAGSEDNGRFSQGPIALQVIPFRQ